MIHPDYRERFKVAIMADKQAKGGRAITQSEFLDVCHTLTCSLVEEALAKAAADAAIAKRAPKSKAAPRGRNPLFDALALATGTKNLGQLTRNAAKAIGVALADILAVTPGLTVEEIHRRADAYRRRWPDPRNLSAPALAKHWGEFAPTAEQETRAAALDVYREPDDWHTYAILLHGQEIADRMKEKGWLELGTDFRLGILKERLKKRGDS